MAKALGGLDGSVLVVCWEKFRGICGSVVPEILRGGVLGSAVFSG